MQIVINISEEIYKRTLPYKDVPVISNLANDFPELIHAVANGVPLPKGHGRLIDADALLKDVRDNSELYFADDFAHEWVDVAPTIIEADRQEKSYGVYEVYTWDDVTYELIEKYETRAEAEARAATEKQKNREAFKPSEEMPTSPYSYAVLSDTEYENLMNNA